MARRRSSNDSSLELLLDTICNTFGGVLFLAMLVSLMLTQTRRQSDGSPSDPRPAVSAADLVRLDTRAAEATDEMKALADQAQHARRAAGHLAVPDAEELLAAMEIAERQAREAAATRTALLTGVATEQAAGARAAATKAADDRERQRLAEEAEAARKRLAAAVEERQRLLALAIEIRNEAERRATVHTTGRPPRMRTTDKAEFAVMLKYGRLYMMKILRNGRQIVNDEDFTVTPGLLTNVAKARPHAGLDLTVADGRDESLRRIMADYPPAQWYACLVIHPDSFEEYLTVKNWLVDHGYECRLMPTDHSVTDSGSVDVRVQ